MSFHQIVACSKNGVIGRDGDLPWRISADLKFFKKTTQGHAIVMGRKTFESIGKPLPGRLSVVVSRQGFTVDHPNVLCVKSIDDAIEVCRKHSDQWPYPAFIVGGGEIYRQTKQVTDQIILTRVLENIEGDTHFTEPSEDGFTLDYVSPTESEGALSFAMETWTREKKASD